MMHDVWLELVPLRSLDCTTEWSAEEVLAPSNICHQGVCLSWSSWLARTQCQPLITYSFCCCCSRCSDASPGAARYSNFSQLFSGHFHPRPADHWSAWALSFVGRETIHPVGLLKIRCGLVGCPQVACYFLAQPLAASLLLLNKKRYSNTRKSKKRNR